MTLAYRQEGEKQPVLLDQWEMIGAPGTGVRMVGKTFEGERLTTLVLDIFGKFLQYEDACLALEEGLIIKTKSGSVYLLGNAREGHLRGRGY